MRVVVIGAGLGGLCLAHGLRQAGVDVQVLERSPNSTAQPASYGIHLNADGLKALRECLPTANWDQLIASAKPARDLVRFHDQRLNLLAGLNRETPETKADPIRWRCGINRGDLHAALLLGDADLVQWGRQFDRYETMPDGRIRVYCADRSETTADLLVGADGSNSRVRKQRLPGLDRQDLAILNIAGRVPLTSPAAARLPATLTDSGVNNIVPAGPGWMFVSTWDTYLVWAWAGDRNTYPADVDDFSPLRLRDLVAERTADWAPEIRDLIGGTDPDTVAAVALRTMPELAAWEPSAITLLGDAVHSMTPMAGVGANTALRDADQLRQALLAPGSSDLVARVGTYEAAMRGYANVALALSTRNARNAATTARLPRAAFRTVLRVAEAVPPVKRRLFGQAVS